MQDGLSDDDARGALSAVPGLSGLTDEERGRLAEKAVRTRIGRGAALVRQGDPADELYIVLAGRFVVMLEGRPGIIAEIGPGEPVGELAFFAGGMRTASVVAARDSEVLMLTRAIYAEIVAEAPGIVSGILASVSKRLAAVTPASPALKTRPGRTIALLPVGASPTVPEAFLARLKRGFGDRSVVVVTRDMLPAAAGDDEAALAERLAAIETSADIVLYAMERDVKGPPRLCLHWADELLLVAPAVDALTLAVEPTHLEHEASKLFMREHRTLVVWREQGDTPITSTKRWLAAREVALHHHVALDAQGDFNRLARFITGDALGFVLSGGGVFGCAHLGVAKALAEAGIAVDFLGGASVGAAMAAALAARVDPDDVLARMDDIFVKKGAMRRLTIPVHSILDHRVFDASLMAHYGERQMEDLPLNCFAVSASLTTNEMRVLRRGSVWEAIRASTAIPGILPPFITHDGDLLVDGALVDNVPVDVMRSLKLGPNIVVLFQRAGDGRVSSGYADIPTRGTILRNLLLRRQLDYPSLVSILMRGMFLTSESIRRMSAPGDLFVTPKLSPDIRLLDWRKGPEIAAISHRHMRDVLAGDCPGFHAERRASAPA